VPKTVALTDAEIAARLRLSATRLARRLRKEAGSGLSPSQGSALAAVHHHGPLTLGALAEHERVAPPTITKVVAFLEHEGLVARRADPDDGRVSRVSTTKAGEALVAESRRRKTAWLATQVGQLAPEEQVRLTDALDVLDHLCEQDHA
jgi:DNA-binding MarR family transcriptional regulator